MIEGMRVRNFIEKTSIAPAGSRAPLPSGDYGGVAMMIIRPPTAWAWGAHSKWV